MGYRVEKPTELFESVRYNTKTTPELREAMKKMVLEIAARIEDREGRMKRIRDEYQIDSERLAALVIQYQNRDSDFVSYQAQGGASRDAVVPAGVIANIIREREMIDSERGQIRKLELVLRNLPETELYNDPRTGEVRSRQPLHQLTDDELEFLGF
jgi:transposase-like protein